MGDTEEALRARSLKFLEDEKLSYQAVELPGGVSTPGSDRSYLNDVIFGDDFKGKSYLDIGSYLGYFCIEAMRRGASEAVGIETDVTNVRQSRKIADLWNLKPDYIHGNFEEWEPDGRRFDVVSCLNVLHHFFDPIHALHKMIAMARSKIVLEVAVPRWRDVFRDRINPLRVFGVGAPAIFLGIPRKRGDAAGRTFLFTPKSLELLFNVHTTQFEPLRVTPSPFKGRIVVEARKRRIGHLVVVAGPTSVGKSTFSDRLMRDAEFRAGFGMEKEPWTLTQAATASELPAGHHERLLLHYDFLRPSRTGMRSHDRDPVLHLMRVADRLTVLTLVAPRSRLREQLEKGEIGRADRKVRKRDLELLESYRTEVFLNDWYSAWVKFCGRFPKGRQTLVRNEGEFSPVPLDTWRNILDQ